MCDSDDYDLDEKINVQCAYVNDATPEVHEFDDLSFDEEDEEAQMNLWDWKVEMLGEYWDYENYCSYRCDGKHFYGVQCPDCRRWFFPDGLSLQNKETRQVVEEKRRLEIQRMRAKKN